MRRLTFFLLTAMLLLSIVPGLAQAQQIHVVQSGETLYSIATRYNTTIDQIAAANGLSQPYVIHRGNQLTIPAQGGAPAPAEAAPAPQPAATYATYTVQRGDSLSIIAAQFNTSYITLMQLNGIADPNFLAVGQVLQVPAPAGAPAPTTSSPAVPAEPVTTGVYTVQRGDSLSTIAAQFGINYFELAQLNGIGNLDVLRVGQVLQVPGAPPPAPTVPEAPQAPDASVPVSTANTGGFELGGQALSFAHPNHMRNARMTWVKRQVKWHGNEHAGNFQHLIDSAHSNGFKVLLSVIGEKTQIAGNPPAFYQSFANFLAGLASGGADAIEVWNEMNIDREWPPGQISGANYTQMLSTAYRAIKSANPATMVVSGAPAPTGFFQGCGPNGADDDCYLREMAAAGAANYMDCVGVHYNAGIVPPNATSGAPVGSSGHYSWYLPRMMQLYRSFFPGKPLCFTELGYLTGEGIGALPGGFAWASHITLRNQADWLAGAVHLTRGSGYVRMMIVWNVDATYWGSDPQSGYAIVRPGGGCPACDTLRAAMGG